MYAHSKVRLLMIPFIHEKKPTKSQAKSKGTKTAKSQAKDQVVVNVMVDKMHVEAK